MKYFSQNFITYHCCGNCYLDSINAIAKFGCEKSTNNPFWKRPIDVTNKIAKSTRSKIDNKTCATRNYVKKCFQYLKVLENNKDTQCWSDYSSDCSTCSESESVTESEKRWSETGQDLVIDIKPDLGKDLIINTKPELEIKQQTPNNKETNKKEIPDSN